jgi:tripartite ATP-independent transporter DctP family solute receptor
MNRRDLLAASAVAGSAVWLSGCSDSTNEASVRLAATDVHPENYPTVQAQKWLAEQLAKASNGTLQIKMYHSGQLGKEADTLDLVRFGGLDLTRVFLGALTNTFPLAGALCLPFVIDDVRHMRRVVDGKVGQAILAGMESRGLIGLAIYDSGARCLYTRAREVAHPDALRGLKIRVPSSDLFIEFMRAMGANPTPLAYGAVYSSLETGLIDGAENNLRSFHASRHVEAAPYFNFSAHSFAPDVLVISKTRWLSLSAQHQELLRYFATASVQVMRTLWDQGEAESRTALLALGAKFVEVDRPAFQQRCAPLVKQHSDDPALAALLLEIASLR